MCSIEDILEMPNTVLEITDLVKLDLHAREKGKRPELLAIPLRKKNRVTFATANPKPFQSIICQSSDDEDTILRTTRK